MVIPPLYLIVIVSTLAGIFFTVATVRAVGKLKPLKTLKNLMLAIVMFLTTTSGALLLVSHKGYRRLTKETVAASVCVEPVDKQLFRTVVILPDSTRKEFVCRGDQLYMDAHILKWHPWLNLLGVHTTYELDRLGGRYFDIDDEKVKPRTVYTLSEKKLLNLFDVRRKLDFLHPVVDARYGSATFIDVHEKVSLEVMVSTSGLLIRKKKSVLCNRKKQ